MPEHSEIIYCHVPKQSRKVPAGHWFYSPLGAIVVASLKGTSDGRWLLEWRLSWEKTNESFDTVEEAKECVGRYFKCPVRTVKTREYWEFMRGDE